MLTYSLFSQGIVLVPEADGKSVGDSLDMDEEGRKSVTFLGASPRGKSLSVYFHKQCMVCKTHVFTYYYITILIDSD